VGGGLEVTLDRGTSAHFLLLFFFIFWLLLLARFNLAAAFGPNVFMAALRCVHCIPNRALFTYVCFIFRQGFSQIYNNNKSNWRKKNGSNQKFPEQMQFDLWQC